MYLVRNNWLLVLQRERVGMFHGVCVYFLPIYSGRQVCRTYQPGSHRRKVTLDFSTTFLLRCVPCFFREQDSAFPFPRRPGRCRILCTNDLIVLHLLGFFMFCFSKEKSQLPGFDFTFQYVRRLRGYQLNYRGDRSCRTYNRQDCRLYSCTDLIFLSPGICKKHTTVVYSVRYHRHNCVLECTSFFFRLI